MRRRLRRDVGHAFLGLAARTTERYHWRSVAAKLRSLVDRAAAALGTTLDAEAGAAIETWLERLEEWNERIDLTAARSPEELVDLMLADAIQIASRIPRSAQVVDVGTGAGAPGLAVALLRPDLRITLVEPLGKRASFLRTIVGVLGRSSIAVERARGESFRGRGAWDVAMSRATWAASAWLELGVTLAAPGGRVWVLLAKDSAPTHPRATVEAEYLYTWPLTGAARRAVVYRVD
jgi:16S rRNA (guanine527-N7)-methyltransferase